jgi:hypothetical protein
MCLLHNAREIFCINFCPHTLIELVFVAYYWQIKHREFDTNFSAHMNKIIRLELHVHLYCCLAFAHRRPCWKLNTIIANILWTLYSWYSIAGFRLILLSPPPMGTTLNLREYIYNFTILHSTNTLVVTQFLCILRSNNKMVLDDSTLSGSPVSPSWQIEKFLGGNSKSDCNFSAFVVWSYRQSCIILRKDSIATSTTFIWFSNYVSIGNLASMKSFDLFRSCCQKC